MNAARIVLGGFLALALVACGGGGGGSGSPPPSNPPATVTYSTPPAYTRNVAIAALVPTVNGTVTAFAVSPALPAGLTLNTTNGQITGTPTAVAAAANYSVTATSAGGTSTTGLTITVNDTAPDVAYGRSNYSLTTEVAVDVSPTSTGGAVTQWTIDAALPAGLSLDAATGKISGTPTQVATSRAYVVTARNSGGTDTFGLTLSVQSGFLLDLGHDRTIETLIQVGDRIMSADDHRGSLWNAQTGNKLAAADNCSLRCIALAPTTAVFLSATQGFTVLDSSDAHLLSQIDFDQTHLAWWTLSTDGTYLCAATNAALTCWSRAGTQLFTRNGNYSSAKAFADAAELRIGAGPAGNQVVEKVAVPSGGSSMTSAFPGTFSTWFTDGQRFLTTAGLVVGVYAKDGTQLELKNLPSVENLGAQQDWIWITTINGIELYRVGGGAAPVTTIPRPGVAGWADFKVGNGALAVLDGTSRIGLVDLSVATPSRTDYVAPTSGVRTFAANSASDWTFGNYQGALFGELNNGPPQYYSLGAVMSITGSASRFAIATGANRIFIYDSATRQLEDFIDVDARTVQISADGTRLAAGTDFPGEAGHSLRVYALPSKNILAQWISNPGDTGWIHGFSLSADGQVIGRVVYHGVAQPFTREVTRLDGTPLWMDTGSREPIRLNPDGSQIAVSSGEPVAGTGTNIYVDGAMTTATSGWAVGWLDASRVLVNRYIVPPRPSVPAFQDTAIFNSAGQTLGISPRGVGEAMQPLGGDAIYVPGDNLIFDVTTGAVLWSTPTSSAYPGGAVAGNSVVFPTYSATVRAESR